MKIECPNPDCRILFEPIPCQETCSYCGTPLKLDTSVDASSKGFIDGGEKVVERKKLTVEEKRQEIKRLIAEERKRRFEILSGNIQPIASSYNLNAREKLFYEYQTQRLADIDYIESHTVGKEKKKGVITRSIVGDVVFGPAGAIIGGVTAGSNTQSTTTQERVTEQEVIDSGTLLLTDRRFMFIGKSVVDIPYDNVLKVDFDKDNVYIKYPQMAKGECYQRKHSDVEFYYHGIMRHVGKDTSAIQESDVVVEESEVVKETPRQKFTKGGVVVAVILMLLFFNYLMGLFRASDKQSAGSPTASAAVQTPVFTPPKPSATLVATGSAAINDCFERATSPAEWQLCVAMKNAQIPPLNATVHATSQYLLVTNNEAIQWRQCDYAIGSHTSPNDFYELGGLLGGPYATIESHQTMEVPWGQLTKNDGTRYNFYTTAPNDLVITCTAGDTTEEWSNY